jgi:hypothetical protein
MKQETGCFLLSVKLIMGVIPSVETASNITPFQFMCDVCDEMFAATIRCLSYVASAILAPQWAALTTILGVCVTSVSALQRLATSTNASTLTIPHGNAPVVRFHMTPSASLWRASARRSISGARSVLILLSSLK